jgi:ABC-type transport system involved in cytochrome bd biosynthesis fused ATPase/permease subunit
VIRTARAILRKDLLIELRTKESVPAMVLFSVTVYVLFHFGLDRDSLDGELASGVLWVTMLLAAVIGVTRLFAAEREQGGIDGLLLAPARVEELLGAVGMEERADDPVRDLSKGLIQRLAVARAVLHEPALLLLDEPRANLDPAAVELLEPLIGRASGRTRVLVSHDVEGALAESDLNLGLRDGRPAPVGAELYR